MIKEEEVAVMSHIKAILSYLLDQYKHQLRGGKGKIDVREEDIDHLYIASTHFISSFLQIPAKPSQLKYMLFRSTKGRAVVNLINIDKDERITAICHVKEFSEDKYSVFRYEKGLVKRVNLSLFKHLRLQVSRQSVFLKMTVLSEFLKLTVIQR